MEAAVRAAIARTRNQGERKSMKGPMRGLGLFIGVIVLIACFWALWDGKERPRPSASGNGPRVGKQNPPEETVPSPMAAPEPIPPKPPADAPPVPDSTVLVIDDASGEAVAGARIVLDGGPCGSVWTWRRNAQWLVTDSAGRVSYDQKAAPARCILLGLGWPLQEVTLTPADGGLLGRARKGEKLRGRVTVRGGRPAPGVDVYITEHGFTPTAILQLTPAGGVEAPVADIRVELPPERNASIVVRTDAEGRFATEVPRDCKFDIVFRSVVLGEELRTLQWDRSAGEINAELPECFVLHASVPDSERIGLQADSGSGQAGPSEGTDPVSAHLVFEKDLATGQSPRLRGLGIMQPSCPLRVPASGVSVTLAIRPFHVLVDDTRCEVQTSSQFRPSDGEFIDLALPIIPRGGGAEVRVRLAGEEKIGTIVVVARLDPIVGPIQVRRVDASTVSVRRPQEEADEWYIVDTSSGAVARLPKAVVTSGGTGEIEASLAGGGLSLSIEGSGWRFGETWVGRTTGEPVQWALLSREDQWSVLKDGRVRLSGPRVGVLGLSAGKYIVRFRLISTSPGETREGTLEVAVSDGRMTENAVSPESLLGK